MLLSYLGLVFLFSTNVLQDVFPMQGFYKLSINLVTPFGLTNDISICFDNYLITDNLKAELSRLIFIDSNLIGNRGDIIEIFLTPS